MQVAKGFFCVEGVDGSGKTSIVRQILKNNLNSVSNCEPTNGKHGQQIRELLKNNEEANPEFLLELFLKDREENQEWIKSHLKEGKTVLLDRYFLSTMAYQGSYFPLETLYQKNAHFLIPEKIFFIDIHPKISLARKFQQLHQNNIKPEIFETELFQEKVYHLYKKSLEYLKNQGYPILEIEGDQSLEKIVSICESHIKK